MNIHISQINFNNTIDFFDFIIYNSNNKTNNKNKKGIMYEKTNYNKYY